MEISCPTTPSASAVQVPDTSISSTPVAELDIESLTVGDSPRLSVPDAEHAFLLSGVEEPLPPILVQRSGLRVIDGVHRLRAATLRGDTTIRAHLFEGPDDAAFLLAVRSNITHGLPLTLAERKAAAERILTAHPEWSDRAIAGSAGLSDKTVAAIRRKASAEIPRSHTRRGADGRVRPLDSTHRRHLAAELIAAHPQASLREIANAVGTSLGTVRDVRDRVDRGNAPVPDSRRAGANGGETKNADSTPAQEHSTSTGLRDSGQRQATLDRMCNDPSLRFSASGRNSVRWLYSQMSRLDQWQELVDDIPLHWTEVIADLARGCADSWQEFAAACESRAQRAG